MAGSCPLSSLIVVIKYIEIDHHHSVKRSYVHQYPDPLTTTVTYSLAALKSADSFKTSEKNKLIQVHHVQNGENTNHQPRLHL